MPSGIGARRCPLALGVVLTVAVLSGTEAEAQQLWGLGLGRWEGAVEFNYHGDRQETKTSGAPSSKSELDRFDERVTIQNTGAYYLDPRFITATASVTFGLFQEQERFDSTSASRNGTLLGYSFDTVIFSEKPYTGTLFANRSETFTNREFGGHTDSVFENLGGLFTLREDSVLQDLGVLHLTSTLGARQETISEDTSILGQRLRRDETRRVVNWDASKGFETADLSLTYEFDDVDERQAPLASFQSHTAGLTYSLDFGENLNKRWESRVRYLTRNGAAREDFLNVDEDLRIDHSRTLFTDYRYLFTRQEVPAGETTTHTGSARLQHRLYENLTTTVLGEGTLQELPQGEHTRYAGQLDLDYQRTLPWNGRIFLNAGGRYQMDDNHLRSSTTDITDEAHSAPSSLGGNAGFTLASPFVIVSTIVVVDARGGARLPTTLGIDYILDQQGDQTRVIPLASSPIILPGDPLLVSYAVSVNPSIEFSTASWHGSGTLDFRWIAVSLSREQSEQTLLGGRDVGLLEDRTIDTARVELRGEWERARAVATAQYRVYDATRLKYTAEEFTQFASYRPLYNLYLNLDSQETFTHFTLPRRETTTYAARAGITWTGVRGLLIDAFADLRIFEDSEVPTETVHEAGLRARWTFGKFELSPDVTWTDRTRGTTETTDFRVNVRVIRRF